MDQGPGKVKNLKSLRAGTNVTKGGWKPQIETK